VSQQALQQELDARNFNNRPNCLVYVKMLAGGQMSQFTEIDRNPAI
jgi:hypothetical protein